jgi:hypothetical protein
MPEARLSALAAICMCCSSLACTFSEDDRRPEPPVPPPVDSMLGFERIPASGLDSVARTERSARWVRVGESVLGYDTSWIDVATVEHPAPQRVVAWFRMSGAQHYQIARLDFDCDARRWRLLELIDYEDPVFARALSQSTEVGSWTVPVPESRAEFQIDMACGLRRSTP